MGVLVSEGDQCSICGERMLSSDKLLNFTFVDMQDERFKLIDDSAIHSSCLKTWSHRDDFVLEWNSKARKYLGKQWLLVEDKDGFYSFNDEQSLFTKAYLSFMRFYYTHIQKPKPIQSPWVNNPNLPKCPECNETLRTAKAKQCLSCGHDWHENT